MIHTQHLTSKYRNALHKFIFKGKVTHLFENKRKVFHNSQRPITVFPIHPTIGRHIPQKLDIALLNKARISRYTGSQ